MRRVAWGLFVLYVAAVLWLTLIDRTSETRRGLCEVDDVFHNTLGTAVGYWLYTQIKQRK